MNDKEERLNLDKYLFLNKLISFDKNKRLFNHYDKLLITKRFDNAFELSTTENILNIETINLTPADICKIVTNFLSSVKSKKYIKNRSLYELIKVSNLSALKINKTISDDKLLIICDNLANVSCETKLINIDFIVLRALDNFIIKIKNPTLKNKFNAVRRDIIRKMMNFNYEPEIKESKITYFYWIDRIFNSLTKRELTLTDLIDLNKKIMQLVPDDLDMYYKILHNVNFLCFQPNYDDQPILRKFKRYVVKQIAQKYKFQDFTPEKTEKLMIRILARETVAKEDYYYLFDAIGFVMNKSIEEKLFCLKLCEYLLYINNEQNIFCYRFIRQAFIGLVYKILDKNDPVETKEEEFRLLAIMLHSDSFFYLNKKELFDKMVELLGDIYNCNEEFSKHKFYRYCDILDYILAHNEDLVYPNIAKKITSDDEEINKISKRFQLSVAV